MVRGVVKDAAGKPVEGAKVSIEAESNNRHFETKSDKKGEFLQIGLAPGAYKVSAEKDKVASAPSMVSVRIAAGNPITLVLGGGGAGVSPEAAAKSAAMKKSFEEGVAASRAGNHDAAIASFQAAAELNPNCFDCYYNIAFSESQKKDYDKAEVGVQEGDRAQGRLRRGLQRARQRLQRAAQVRPGGHGQRKGDGVERQRRRRGRRRQRRRDVQSGRDSLERRARSPRRRSSSRARSRPNPNHAESHYQLGMALVNEGNLAGAATEFETYLKLSPTGPNAATAKGILGTLKK